MGTTMFSDLKARVRSAQRRAHQAVQNEMVTLYWSIGKTILEHQQKAGWGAQIVSVSPRISVSSSPRPPASTAVTFCTCAPSPQRVRK